MKIKNKDYCLGVNMYVKIRLRILNLFMGLLSVIESSFTKTKKFVWF